MIDEAQRQLPILLKTKQALILELVAILGLALISLRLSFGGGLPVAPWLAVWITLLTTWLLPGFLLWRLIGVPASPAWFEWLPLSFGLGLAWLILPAGAVFIFQSNLDRFIQVMASLNILLVLGHILLRLTNRLNWPIGSAKTAAYPLNRWLLGGALITLFILLAVFFNSAGYTFNDDQWHLIANVRYLLDTETGTTNLGFEPWDLLIAFITRLARSSDLIDTYLFYLPPLFVLIACLVYLVLAKALFDDQNVVYFAFIIQGLYLLSDIDFYYTFNSAGLGFLARLTEDKFAAWLLILPLAQAFFLKFLRSERYYFLILFGVMAIAGTAIHALTAAWLAFSISAVGLFLLLYRRDRVVITFYGFYLVLLGCIVALAWWLRSLRNPINFALSDPSHTDLIEWFVQARYLQILSLEPESYMLPLSLLNHPLVILALILSVLLIFKLKHSLAAQFLVSNTVVVVLLLFNPVTAPLMGRLTSPFMLHRIMWMLPVSLTVAYGLYEFIQTLHQFLLSRFPTFSPHSLFFRLSPLLVLLVLTVSLWGHIEASWRSLHAANNGPVITPAERELMTQVRQTLEPGNGILTSFFLNRHHLPAFVSDVRKLPYRWGTPGYHESLADSNHFYNAQRVDQSIVDSLNRYAINYIIIERDKPLEAHLSLMPGLFNRLFANSDYAFYAWRPEQISEAEKYLIEGNTYFLEGDLTDAEMAYQRALQQQPYYPLAELGLGAVYESRLELDQALDLYQTAVQVNPDNPWLRIKLANALYQMTEAISGDEIDRIIRLYLQALESAAENGAIYDQVLAAYVDLSPAFKETPAGQTLKQTLLSFYQARTEAEPDDFQRQQKLAVVYKQLDDEEQAIAQNRLMSQRFPGNVEPYLEQARIFIQQNNIDMATQTYQTAIQHKTNPESIEPYLGLSHLYRQKENYQQALEYAQQALAIVQGNNGRYHIGQAHLELAYIYQAQQKISEAEQHLLRALEMLPNDAGVYGVVGDFYRQQGNFELAAIFYRRAADLQPDVAHYQIRLGETLLEMGRSAEAIDALQTGFSLGIESNNVPYPVYLALIRSYRRQGNNQKALEYAHKVISLTQDPQTKANIHVELGYIYAAQHNEAKAVEHIRQAVELAPWSSLIYQELGGLALRYQKPETALSALDEAVQRDPQNIKAHLLLGEVLTKLDRMPEAAQTYNTAIVLAQRSQSLYQIMMVGQSLRERQEWSRAIEIYETAIEQGITGIDIYLQLGDIYHILEAHDQAFANYQQALQLLTDLEKFELPLTYQYLSLADRLWANGDQAGAVTIWEDKILGHNVKNLYANWRLAQYYRGRTDADEEARYRESAQYFSLESITPSNTDYRLSDYQSQAFLGLVEDGLWSRETLLNVVSYRVRQDQGPATERLLQAMLALYPDDADLHYYQGEMYYQRDDFEQAKSAYQKTVRLDENYGLAYLRLGMMAEVSCKTQDSDCAGFAQALTAYEGYHRLAPDNLLGLKKLADVYRAMNKAEASTWQTLWLEEAVQQGPTITVNQSLEDGWTFLGYRTDEQRLVWGEPTSLWLYWQGSPGRIAGNETEGWYPLGKDRWLQIIEEANNLIFNGGFELGLMAGLPSGFPDTVYRADAVTRRLSRENPTGIQTTVALLENSEVYSRTSFASSDIPIDPKALYLQTGWVSSREGYAFMGRLWVGDISEERLPYNYVAAGVQPTTWQHYAGVAEPPPGAKRAKVWLLNYQTIGQAYFDKVTFIKIGRPGG